jgi:hypothetical protein
LQLQNICSYTLDKDILERVGKLPATLETLYSEHYETLSNTPGDFGKSILRNVLTWLLCAHSTMRSADFLTAVSITPNMAFESISREQVLELCNNFVVFDTRLDTFRFAHLSVREFLEKRPLYTTMSANSLAAEICLLRLIAQTPNSSARAFLSKRNLYPTQELSEFGRFSDYPTINWMSHYKQVLEARARTSLSEVFEFFISGEADSTSAFSIWLGGSLYQMIYEERCRAGPASIFFLAAFFDLPDILQRRHADQVRWANLINESGESLFQVCATRNSVGVMKFLVENCGDDINVAESVVRGITGHIRYRNGVLAVLLGRLGDELKEVFEAEATNMSSGKEIFLLLLAHERFEVPVTSLYLFERFTPTLSRFSAWAKWWYVKGESGRTLSSKRLTETLLAG